MIKKLSVFFLLNLGLVFLLIPVPKKNKNFSLEAVSAKLPFQLAWEGREQNEKEKKETETALSQSYRFLGGGGQCFSFISQDGKYVIKFFKQKAFPPRHWLSLNFEKTDAKRDRVFSAFRLSFDRLSEETGMLYIHLNPTQHLHKTVLFSDISGKEHLLNLDELQFVVQKKADLANGYIDTLLARNDVDGAKDAINQLLSLSMRLHEKGVRNRDPNFRSNYGFVDGRPIVVDVGRMASRKKSAQKDLRRFKEKFRIYLAKEHPELLEYFDLVCKKNI
jgi:hypothetical protein